MIFTKLIVDNFGLFRGKNEFVLTPLPNKPIILFGGKNGSGKTTLFEAFKLCLYGRTFKGVPLSTAKYEKHLRKGIHRYAGIIVQPDYASIQLEFKYVQLGLIDNYKIKRYWKIENNNIKESFEVYKNDKLLEDIEEYQWQDFIKGLIPAGLTKLFFFDGEKIQNLAEDTNNTQLKDSFYSLLGIDILEKLVIDLNILKNKYSRDKPAELDKEEILLNTELKKISRELELLYEKRSQMQNEVDHILGSIERLETRLANEGGNYAIRREELKKEKESIDKDIENIENNIRELMHGLLPFTASIEYCEKLKKSIILEEKYMQEQAANRAIENKLILLYDRLAENIFSDIEINDSTKPLLLNRVIKIVEEIFKPSSTNIRIVHNLSTSDSKRLLKWIDETLLLPKTLKEYTTKLDKLLIRRREIEKKIMRAPPSDVISPLIKELNKLHMSMGEKKQLLKQLEEEIRTIELKKKEIERKIEELYKKKDSINKISARMVLVEKVKKVANDFINRLEASKKEEFADNLLMYLNMLSHKKIFEKVVIDKDFNVLLYQKNGNVVKKEDLSAGERQIYAVATIWALAKTSGRALPFIIDTPLARLDSEHRNNIVTNFFTNASYQTIIFSTDTEIDRRYFDVLRPYISHAYHLEYDTNNGSTNVSEGYFWQKSVIA